MKCLSAKGFQRRSGLLAQLIRLRLETAAVDFVPQEWVSDRGQVDADLVRAPALEPAGAGARAPPTRRRDSRGAAPWRGRLRRIGRSARGARARSWPPR